MKGVAYIVKYKEEYLNLIKVLRKKNLKWGDKMWIKPIMDEKGVL